MNSLNNMNDFQRSYFYNATMYRVGIFYNGSDQSVIPKSLLKLFYLTSIIWVDNMIYRLFGLSPLGKTDDSFPVVLNKKAITDKHWKFISKKTKAIYLEEYLLKLGEAISKKSEQEIKIVLDYEVKCNNIISYTISSNLTSNTEVSITLNEDFHNGKVSYSL